ncbi:MAG: hypothetical protein N3G80_02625 [Candidatus Micrarchaeota archaeon]|nr:hypothetical protein [Candidatus Micrarchaeota archaeon]
MRLSYYILIALFVAISFFHAANVHMLQLPQKEEYGKLKLGSTELIFPPLPVGQGILALVRHSPENSDAKVNWKIYYYNPKMETGAGLEKKSTGTSQEIVFKKVKIWHYPKSTMYHHVGLDGSIFQSFDYGPVLERIVKDKGEYTPEYQWRNRYYLDPKNFENGAGYWFYIGELQDFSIADVEREIAENGRFVVRWIDWSGNLLEYEATELYVNKLTGLLRVISNEDSKPSLRFIRLEEAGQNLLFYLTSDYADVDSIEFIDFYNIYLEGFPHILQNFDEVGEKIEAFVQEQFNLSSLIIGFSWSGILGGGEPEDYHKALVSVMAIKTKDRQKPYAIIMVHAHSDEFMLSRRIKVSWGTYLIDSAKYADSPNNLESLLTFKGQQFGFIDENGNPTGPVLIGYLSENFPQPYFNSARKLPTNICKAEA